MIDQRKSLERQGIRRLSSIQGGGLLLICGLQTVLGFALLPLLRWVPELQSSSYGASLIVLATTVLTICPGALLMLRLLSPLESNNALPFGRPFPRADGKRWLLCVALVFAGLAACFAGSLVSALISWLAEEAGMVFESPEFGSPTNIPMLLAELLAVALGPAVIEELLMRGAVMQPLRRYGDGFAITMSALLFALLHGNMVQAPFAFVCGLALGYITVRSGSLWPAMVVHFINNGFSVLVSYMNNYYSEEAVERFSSFYVVVIFVLGLAGAALYWAYSQPQPQPRYEPAGKRAPRYLFGSVPMVIALLYFLGSIILTTTMGN
ncbi:MAG: CPBP family intramembrane metalloprotease [Oscillospiraceae bacterium]|nr:CPBP family intramembrane metalloprotease [Oscillospiraceae bacterium]